MLRRFVRVASFLLVASSSPWLQAQGQTPPQSSEGARERARDRFQEGVRAYGEGRFKDAVDLLLEAERAMHSPDFAYNIALAYDAMQDASSALRWFRTYLREAPNAEDRPTVADRISVLESVLQQRGVQQVTIFTAPDGATVSVDGRPLGVTPWTGELLFGRHRLTIDLRGYSTIEQTFDVQPHRARDFVFQLAPASAGTSSSPSGEAAPRDEAATTSATPIGLWTWAAVGAGGLALGGALFFEVGRASAVEDARGAPQVEYEDALETAKRRQTTARVLAGVGGALMVTGGVLLALDLTRSEEPPVAASCGGQGCFVSTQGTF